MKRGRHLGLRSAFPIVAAALGRRFGVDVVIQGDDAMTNGKTIVIPALPPDSELKEVAWGYLAHEAAHVRYTDFDVIKKSNSSPLRRAIANILEDIRIEKALALDYPGTRQTIGKVVEYLLDRKQLAAPPEDVHPAGLLQAYLLLRLRADVLSQSALSTEADKTEAMLRRSFPKGAVTRLNGLLASVPALSASFDALRLADDILRMLKEEREKQAQEEASSSGPERTVSNSSIEGSISDSEAADTADKSKCDGSQATDSHGSAEAGQGAGGQSGSRTNAGPQALERVLTASDTEVVEDLFQAIGETLRSQSLPDEVFIPEIAHAADSRNARHELLSEAIAESSRLRTRLTGLVQAYRTERPWDKARGRAVNSKRLHRLVLGDSRIFVDRTHRVAPNTAIHLLVDTSSSMSEEIGRRDSTRTTRCDIALRSAFALALALEGIRGVSLAVTSFPSYRAGASVVLQHGERVRPNAGRFAQAANGGTPMAPAMWYAASVLMSRREPRKVMMVLTDGMPDNEQSTRDIVTRCGVAGIEVIGIGIELPGVTALFPMAVVITQVKDLRDALFDIARRTLTAV